VKPQFQDTAAGWGGVLTVKRRTLSMAKVQVVKEPNAIVRYYRETVGELRKVVWPTREEAFRLTQIVLIVITATAIVLGTADYLFGQLIRLLITLGG
jgi:preprotein translocase subunit SecE